MSDHYTLFDRHHVTIVGEQQAFPQKLRASVVIEASVDSAHSRNLSTSQILKRLDCLNNKSATHRRYVTIEREARMLEDGGESLYLVQSE